MGKVKYSNNTIFSRTLQCKDWRLKKEANLFHYSWNGPNVYSMYHQSCAPNFYSEAFWTPWTYSISVQDFVVIGIYFFIFLLWVFEFGRIFELYKMHWINQNWLTILQDKSKIYIIICCQAFWVANLLFESKFWYGYTYFCDIKHSKSN